jgi:dolichol-phosphate mannosyltransferase
MIRGDVMNVSAPALSVIVPTRNERDNIPRLLERLRAALAGIAYEVIFVDDSTDGTERLLADIAQTDPRVRVHHRPGGSGLASAVLEGFAISRGDRLGVMDADLQHPPDLIPRMVHALDREHADLVIASRYLPGAARPGLTWLRKGISQALRWASWGLLRAARQSTDPMAGCFIVRRAVIDGVRLQPIGFKILLEILARGRYTRVVEVPYVFDHRHAGVTKATVRQGIDVLRHLAALTADSPADSRLWKFLLVGASGTVVNVLVFWLIHYVLGSRVLTAGTVAGLVATFTNFILNNAYTWADRRRTVTSSFVQRLGKYYVATWAGYAVYLGLLSALTYVGVTPMFANLLAIGVGGLLNYIAHNVWTWREQRTGS